MEALLIWAPGEDLVDGHDSSDGTYEVNQKKLKKVSHERKRLSFGQKKDLLLITEINFNYHDFLVCSLI